MWNIEEETRKTDQALLDPQPGDRFSEFLSFYVYVVAREGDNVVTMETPRMPCELPKDGRVRVQTIDEFRKRLAYGGDPSRGFWAYLIDRGNNVTGWWSEGTK